MPSIQTYTLFTIVSQLKLYIVRKAGFGCPLQFELTSVESIESTSCSTKVGSTSCLDRIRQKLLSHRDVTKIAPRRLEVCDVTKVFLYISVS